MVTRPHLAEAWHPDPAPPDLAAWGSIDIEWGDGPAETTAGTGEMTIRWHDGLWLLVPPPGLLERLDALLFDAAGRPLASNATVR